MKINFFPTAVKLAVKEANKSEYYQKVGAVIVKKKIVLSKGHNCPHKSRRKLHPRFQQWPDSIHAEVDAILKARTNLKNASIYVIRVGSNNKLLLAKPCKYCMAYLKYVGIRKVFYSTDEYPYIKIKNV